MLYTARVSNSEYLLVCSGPPPFRACAVYYTRKVLLLGQMRQVGETTRPAICPSRHTRCSSLLSYNMLGIGREREKNRELGICIIYEIDSLIELMQKQLTEFQLKCSYSASYLSKSSHCNNQIQRFNVILVIPAHIDCYFSNSSVNNNICRS